ncbi:MAG: hypothetical protein ACRCZE_01220 [Candidatus Altimarinota bacterium]
MPAKKTTVKSPKKISTAKKLTKTVKKIVKKNPRKSVSNKLSKNNLTSPTLISNPNEIIQINNEGQKVLYLIRKSYQEGSLYSSNDVTPEIQFILNKPTEIDPKLYQADPQDIIFLQEIIKKVEHAKIHLFTPSSLLNPTVYEVLPPSQKAKADFDILTLLNKIRSIKKLWDSGERNSYQIINLTRSLRLSKERLEQSTGDVFII